MRQWISLFEAAQLSPNIVEDDGDVPHALWATFDEEGEAHIRYWATDNGYIAIQTMHSSPTVRGRDMLIWLDRKYGRPIAVVEAIPEALGFWERMQKEGLVYSVDGADGQASDLERRSIPIDQEPNDQGEEEADDRPEGGWYFTLEQIIGDYDLDRAKAEMVAKTFPHAYRAGDSFSVDYNHVDEFVDAVDMA